MAFTQTQDLDLRPPARAAGQRQRFQLALAGGPHAPERARAWLGNIGSWFGRETQQSLALLISELVNNAVRHGGAGHGELIELEVRPIANGLGVRVTDPGPGFAPKDREKPIDEPGGWGLVLVDQMTERWGVMHDGRTHVWFELRCDLL